MRIAFNTQILEDLLYRFPDKATEVNLKFPKLIKWQQRLASPTVDQLEQLANFFNVPFGYFFLQNLPDITYAIPHYRTSKGNVGFKPSMELISTINILEQRQDWAKEALAEIAEPLPYAGKFNIKSNVVDAAENIRTILGVGPLWSRDNSFTKWIDAFRFLINKVEDAGIFVVVNGVVNNNTSRKLDINEFRGFVLHDEFAPFIFINSNDFVSGKIFTIVHEIAHILIGRSASFDYEKLLPATNEIEEFCDAVAAEFLVPEDILLNEFNIYGKNYDRLSNLFKVSRVVIARRLLDNGIIDKPSFFSAYNSFTVLNTEKSTPKSEGGDFYNTAPYRISRSFFSLVYSAVKQNKILYRDAFRLTGLTPKSFDGYVEQYLVN